MGMQSKIFRVQALMPFTITNGTGQSLVLKKGDIGTFQVVTTLGLADKPILLINVAFNGKSIHIQSKGSVDPKVPYDETLKQMILLHDNGKPPIFKILSDKGISFTKNSDLSNADGMDDRFGDLLNYDVVEYSNFSLLGIGKPSARQIVKWEKKDPKKISYLLSKGKITQSDIDAANAKEKYTPSTPAKKSSDSSTSTSSSDTTLPFDSATFISYIKSRNLNYAQMQEISTLLEQIRDGIDKGLTSEEIAEFGNTFTGADTPLKPSDIDTMRSIVSDDASMKAFKELAANAPKPSVVSQSQSNSPIPPAVRKEKKILGMRPSVAYPVFIVGAIGLILLGSKYSSKIFGSKKVVYTGV